MNDKDKIKALYAADLQAAKEGNLSITPSPSGELLMGGQPVSLEEAAERLNEVLLGLTVYLKDVEAAAKLVGDEACADLDKLLETIAELERGKKILEGQLAEKERQLTDFERMYRGQEDQIKNLQDRFKELLEKDAAKDRQLLSLNDRLAKVTAGEATPEPAMVPGAVLRHLPPEQIYLAARSTWVVRRLNPEGIPFERPLKTGAVERLGNITSNEFRDNLEYVSLRTIVIPMAHSDKGDDFFIDGGGTRVDMSVLMGLRERSSIAFLDKLETFKLLPWCGFWKVAPGLRGVGIHRQDHAKFKDARLSLLGDFFEFSWPKLTQAQGQRPCLVADAPVKGGTPVMIDGVEYHTVPNRLYPMFRIKEPSPRMQREITQNAMSGELKNKTLFLYQPSQTWECQLVYGAPLPRNSKDKRVLYLGHRKFRMDLHASMSQFD